jgi:hypothetical protein
MADGLNKDQYNQAEGVAGSEKIAPSRRNSLHLVTTVW